MKPLRVIRELPRKEITPLKIIKSSDIHLINHLLPSCIDTTIQSTFITECLYIHFKSKEFSDGSAKLSNGRANALPCPPLAMPMSSCK